MMNKELRIYIDTSESKKATVKLIGEKTFVKEGTSALLLIKELLDEHNISLSDISAIDVNPGPGSYTGVKIGVAVANALNFALGKKSFVIPVLREIKAINY